MSGEKSTDMQAIGSPVKGDFEAFARETGRELKLEIEPGTFLVANAGSLVCTVQVIRKGLLMASFRPRALCVGARVLEGVSRGESNTLLIKNLQLIVSGDAAVKVSH